jgi:DNA-binding PadR family transcriptional regulator
MFFLFQLPRPLGRQRGRERQNAFSLFFRSGYGPMVYSRSVLHESGNAMTSTKEARDPRAFLPLKADFFHILLALSEEDLHGYGIMKAVEQNTGGEIRLEPSPLYRRLKRLLEDGIVDESGEGPFLSSGDPRRRYYRLTPFGRSVLASEATRVVELAQNHRVKALAAGGGRA